MSFWRRFIDWTQPSKAAPAAAPKDSVASTTNTIELPAEAFVFECQSCGKVFDARRKHPSCPECDSTVVSQMSD